jgi:D-alanine-D-alanine ligase
LVHYDNPKVLADHAAEHSDDVVLSIFGGSASRSRMALVPAICETFGLAYVGPDAYGRIICQDKEVSKTLAATAGLTTAPHRLVRSPADIDKISDFPLPYVAKPLWEGSSIGIGADNLITSRQRGASVLRDLLQHFRQPIMAESFVPGREVSWCFINGEEQRPLRAMAEVIWNGDPRYFDTHLYDAPHKLMAEGRKTVRTITEELRPADAEAMERLLTLVGPIGYGRVDGKLKDGVFVFIEITPDAWLGSSGSLASSFGGYGLIYAEVIAQVLLSARKGPPGL